MMIIPMLNSHMSTHHNGIPLIPYHPIAKQNAKLNKIREKQTKEIWIDVPDEGKSKNEDGTPKMKRINIGIESNEDVGDSWMELLNRNKDITGLKHTIRALPDDLGPPEEKKSKRRRKSRFSLTNPKGSDI